MDLLLYLIKKEEVDIYQVNLTKLATQFIEYIDVMRMLDLEIAGEFLVMASTLMYIKSRELLPKAQQVQPEEEADDEDPRWELIRQLVEYKKFKDAASQLQTLEVAQENIFPRVPGKIDLVQQISSPKSEVSLFDLINAVNSVLKRISQREELRDIFEEKWTVSQKIETVLQLLTATELVKFSDLFEAATSRYEVVCTFLAVLELTRLKQVLCMQSEDFGEIHITKVGGRPAAVEETPEEESVVPAASPTPLPASESPILDSPPPN